MLCVQAHFVLILYTLLGGYVLNDEEVTALQEILLRHDGKVIEQLKNKGLILEGRNITIEEVKYYLRILGMVDEANNLRDKLERYNRKRNNDKI